MKLWEVRTGKLLNTFPIAEGVSALYTVRFAPNGRHVLTSGSDGAFRSLDIKTGDVKTIAAGVGYVQDTAFSVDGRLMAIPLQGNIAIFKAGSWEAVKQIQLHRNGAIGMAFHPRGRYLASTGGDGQVRVYDLAAQKECNSFEPGTGGGRRVAWDTSGRTIVCPSPDGLVRVFGMK